MPVFGVCTVVTQGGACSWCLPGGTVEPGETLAQGIVWPFDPGVTRRDVYGLRDRGELTRQDLRDLFCRPPAAGEAAAEVEVPGVPGQEPR